MKLLTRKRTGAAAVALAMMGAMLAPTPAFAAPVVVYGETREVNDAEIRLDQGHIDTFTPVLNEDGTLRLLLKEDHTATNTLRTPESVELFVKEAAKLTFPDGYVPGVSGDVYHLPLTQDHNLIWPGWETQLIQSQFPGADTDIVVSEIDGPGQVFLWTAGAFGFGTVPLTKEGSFELPNTISQPYPAHTHAAWAFTEPGTYKFSVQANVTATNGATGSTQVATYTFVVAERTQLTPEAPTQSGNTVTIPEHRWITYTDGAGNVLSGSVELSADLTVNAAVAYGFDLAGGATASWNFEYEAPVTQSLAITGLAHHYHQGSPILLQAIPSPLVDGAQYEWLLQRVDQSAPVPVTGATGQNVLFPAEQALDGALVTARLLAADGTTELAVAPAVTIEIDDHGAAPFNVVTISGAAHHYHTGDMASLTAGVEPLSVLNRYEWQVRLAGETDWETVADVHGDEYEFEVTEALDGAHVRAVLTYNDGTPYVTSAPIEIEIDDHGAGDHGDDEHGDDEDEDHPKPEGSPSEPAENALDGITAGGIELDRNAVDQGGTVRVQVGEGTDRAGEWIAAWMFSTPVLLGGDWQLVGADGSILVRIPANTTPGAHSVAVYDAAGQLIGWQSLDVRAADGGGAGGADASGAGASGAGAGGGLATTGSGGSGVALGGAALAMIAAGAALVLMRRRGIAFAMAESATSGEDLAA